MSLRASFCAFGSSDVVSHLLTFCDGESLLRLASITKRDRALLKYASSPLGWRKHAKSLFDKDFQASETSGYEQYVFELWATAIHKEFLADQSYEWVLHHVVNKQQSFTLCIPNELYTKFRNGEWHIPDVDGVTVSEVNGTKVSSIKLVFDGDEKPVWMIWQAMCMLSRACTLPMQKQNYDSKPRLGSFIQKSQTRGMSYVIRGAKAWEAVEEGILSVNMMNIYKSLRPGNQNMKFDHILALKERGLFTKMTEQVETSLLNLYGLLLHHDGQEVKFTEYLGLFGGVTVYDHDTNSFLLPLDQMVRYTFEIRTAFEEVGIDISGCDFFVIAMSPPRKYVIYNLNKGTVEIFCPSRRQFVSISGKADLVEWFHEYGRKLSSGYFVSEIHSSGLRKISQFPTQEPFKKKCVTKGILVTMSRALVNEHHFCWTYEISIRLLCPGEDGYMSPENRGFETAQLWRRHWELERNDGEIDIVDDVAVVGKHPIVGTKVTGQETCSYYIDAPHNDEEVLGTFRYCSMVGDDVKYFGGYLVFVPGKLSYEPHTATILPPRNPFVVNLARMEMSKPALTW